MTDLMVFAGVLAFGSAFGAGGVAIVVHALLSRRRCRCRCRCTGRCGEPAPVQPHAAFDDGPTLDLRPDTDAGRMPIRTLGAD